jgi:hypothetical protein
VRVALLSLLLIGCAKKPLRNYQPDVPTRTYIQLKNCHDGEKGDYYCDKAHFVPVVVKVQ